MRDFDQQQPIPLPPLCSFSHYQSSLEPAARRFGGKYLMQIHKVYKNERPHSLVKGVLPFEAVF